MRGVGRPLVALDHDVILARGRVVLDPVGHVRSADDVHPKVVQPEQDGVADDVAVVIAGDKLLGLVAAESLVAVDREVGEQAHRVRSLNVQVGHMV